jgi:EAL domain-containing protein (putative c-di-GMP-specific phosphodiesterase class I)
VLSAAEAACAAAKESGRNQIAVYREDDNLVARRKSWMQSIVQLHEALDSDRIRLRCQRIAPLFPDGEKRGHYEVLLGVVGPDGAEVPLGPFISAAENFNRMGIVDQAVVRRTLTWMTQHRAVLESVGGFAINLSGDSLNNPQLVDFIAQAFKETGADPTKICFEVTESLAIASLDRATELIHRIKSLGCRFALDDFGSGMASYSYLKKLPVDWVKIDGTFIKDLAHSESDFAVVKSINEISHFLGKETIAEYVENETIAERLRRIGVDYAQGYGIEKPRYLNDLAKDLEAVGPVREAVAQALPDAGNDATVPSPPQERPAA